MTDYFRTLLGETAQAAVEGCDVVRGNFPGGAAFRRTRFSRRSSRLDAVAWSIHVPIAPARCTRLPQARFRRSLPPPHHHAPRPPDPPTQGPYVHDAAHGGHAFTFYQVLIVVGFLAAIWGTTSLFKRTVMPPLLGQILLGIILGPEVLNVFETEARTAMVSTVGEVGLWLLVLYAGLEIDTSMLTQIGVRAFFVAVVGITGSVVCALCMGLAIGFDARSAFAAACVIAPSSLAVVSAVLSPAGYLNNPTGQLLVTAAAYDDVMALVLLSELPAIVDPTFVGIFVPVLSSTLAVLILGYLAVFKVPGWLSDYVLPRVPQRHVETFLVALMFCTAAALATALQACKSSQYLGIFLTGVTFSSLDSMEHIWHETVAPVADWLIAVFFTSTVGFEIPIRKFGQAKVVGGGLAFFAGVFGKLFTGLLANPLKTEWSKVGTAMMAMGEFSFVISAECLALGLLDEEQEAQILLATLLAILFPPFILSVILKRSSQRLDSELDRAIDAADAAGRTVKVAGAERVYYRLNIRCVQKFGLLNDALSRITASKMDVLDVRVKYQGHLTVVEGYLQDESVAVDPEDPSRAMDALQDRIRSIKGLLAPLVEHDPRAAPGTVLAAVGVEERQAQVLASLDPAAAAGRGPHAIPLHDPELDEILHDLRGVSLVRWLPAPVEAVVADDDPEEEDQLSELQSQKDRSEGRAAAPKRRVLSRVSAPFPQPGPGAPAAPPAAAASALGKVGSNPSLHNVDREEGSQHAADAIVSAAKHARLQEQAKASIESLAMNNMGGVVRRAGMRALERRSMAQPGGGGTPGQEGRSHRGGALARLSASLRQAVGGHPRGSQSGEGDGRASARQPSRKQPRLGRVSVNTAAARANLAAFLGSEGRGVPGNQPKGGGSSGGGSSGDTRADSPPSASPPTGSPPAGSPPAESLPPAASPTGGRPPLRAQYAGEEPQAPAGGDGLGAGEVDVAVPEEGAGGDPSPFPRDHI